MNRREGVQPDGLFLLFLAPAGEGKDWSLRCINGILRPSLYANLKTMNDGDYSQHPS